MKHQRRSRLASLVASPIIAVTRSLSEMEDQARSLGLTLPAKYGKRELVELLGNHYWEKENPGVPKPNFEQPQLIKSITDLSPEKQESLWKDDSGWSVEPKRNGIRCIGYIGSKSTFTSRNVSVENFLPQSLTKALFWLDGDMSAYEGTVVDGEVISSRKDVDLRAFTKGKGSQTGNVLQAATGLIAVERTEEAQQANGMPLRFVLYDILKYKGKDIKSVPYIQRRDYLAEVFTVWQQKLSNPTSLILNESISQDKKAYFEKCISEGGEGCVLKLHQGIYKPGPTRTNEQLKVKKQLELDCVVSGFVPPQSGRFLQEQLVGGLVFSCKDTTDQEWHKVAAVSNISDEFRREITLKDDSGKFIGIKPETYNRVFEIEGMEFNKNAQLSHARIIRERVGADGKSPEECTFDRQAILKQLSDDPGNA